MKNVFSSLPPILLASGCLFCVLLCSECQAFPQDNAKVEITPETANRDNGRPPKGSLETEYWFRNMITYHQFDDQEIHWATGIKKSQITDIRKQLKEQGKLKLDFPDNHLLVLPYPGGRHPRIGFLDGALQPQRETKISVFLPWDRQSYVVVDVPEAIWSNLGLTYLAHTHIPTVFDKQGVKLKTMEWDRSTPNRLFLKRILPNKIEFSSEVLAKKDHVRMQMTLTNGTMEKLEDLRVQNCVMLRGAKGFEQQSNENKRYFGPYVVCHGPEKKRWIITAWKPLHRAWANGPCPCLHSDPKFKDCEPGETKNLEGWLSFYEGKAIEDEIDRIEKTRWWKNSMKSDKSREQNPD